MTTTDTFEVSAAPTAPVLDGAELSGLVFVVDDEPMVTTSLQTMLELDGTCRVQSFNHPAQALEAAIHERPDVVISDFLMPDMDGIAFLQAVKAHLPESTLILLTGYADKENAVRAVNTVGIYKYLEKPWDNERIKQVIHHGIERARLVGNLRRTVGELSEARTRLETHRQTLEQEVAKRTADVQATNQKLTSIIQGTADGIMTLDPERNITSVNPAAERWLVRYCNLGTPFMATAEAILSAPAGQERQPDQDVPAWFGTEPGETVPREARMGTLPVEVSISTQFEAATLPSAPAPCVTGYVVVIRDISRRKEVDRLRDDFVSTLTHDLRTPLLAAIQTLGFLEDGSTGELTGQQTDIIRMMIQSNRDMLGLVNVLLEVYKYESGRQQLVMARVELAPMIKKTLSELNALAQAKQQTLQLAAPEDLPAAYGDYQELRRVLINLVGNAIHHTPAGGVIQVRAQRYPIGRTGQLIVNVIDNGRGIPAADIPKLFRRFSQGTSKVRNSGTGLGLYLSRQIIEAHQGKIWVESTEGEGTCFSFTLPGLKVPVTGDAVGELQHQPA